RDCGLHRGLRDSRCADARDRRHGHRGVGTGKYVASVTSLGVTFRPQRAPEELRAVAEAADESGVDELWLWEDCFEESGVASAAAALAWTERLHVGIGI